MDEINRISNRILDDARAEATRIIEEAETQARSLIDDKLKEVEKHNERHHKETVEKARDRRRRMLTMARLEMGKEILSAKQQLIDEVLEGANQAIAEKPRDEYRGIISKMLLESSKGDEEVFFSLGDQDKLDQTLIDEVNNKLKSRGKKGELKLAPERGNFDGGFILRSGRMEINCTFGSIIRMNRDNMESELSRILFGEEG